MVLTSACKAVYIMNYKVQIISVYNKHMVVIPKCFKIRHLFSLPYRSSVNAAWPIPGTT